MLEPKLKTKDITFSVLNGIYPARAIKNMSKVKLTRLIYHLVQYTASIVGHRNKRNGLTRPLWWPKGIIFNNNATLPDRITQKVMRVTLEQLVRNCSQFFKTTEIDDYEEKRVIHTRNRSKRQLYSSLVTSINKEHIRKRQFLQNCGLQRVDATRRNHKCVDTLTPKLMNTYNIPLSSDIGRLLIRKSNHQMPEDVIIRKIEKTEWYINRPTTNKSVIVDNQTNSFKNTNSYCHIYKMPKRQFYQQHRSFYDVEFLKLFCKPVSVRLERMEFDKTVDNNKNNNKLCDKKVPIVLLKNLNIKNCLK